MNHTYYLGEVLKGGTRALVSAGVENARYDAEELLGHVTGVSPRELLLHRDRELEEETARRFFDLIRRRCEHYPLQYLLQEWDFYNLSFTVRAPR